MCHPHGQHQLTSPRIIFAAGVLCNQIFTALNKQWVKSIILYVVEGIVGLSPGDLNIHGSPDWWADPIANGGGALPEVPWSPQRAPTCMFPPSVSHPIPHLSRYRQLGILDKDCGGGPSWGSSVRRWGNRLWERWEMSRHGWGGGDGVLTGAKLFPHEAINTFSLHGATNPFVCSVCFHWSLPSRTGIPVNMWQSASGWV